MKVLHIFNEIRFSGAEVMYASAASRFRVAGVTSMAVSTGLTLGDYAPHFEAQGIQTRHLPFLKTPRLFFTAVPYIFRLSRLLREERIDVLHIHREQLYWCFAAAAFLARVGIVRTVHNVFAYRGLGRPRECLLRFLSRAFLGVVFQTIGKSVYENELMIFRNRSVRINNWFDADKFYPVKSSVEKRVARERLGLGSDDFVIISAGSCSDIKNHVDIVRALARITPQIDCVYLHLGCGAAEAAEKALAIELGVIQHIHFLGIQADVRGHLIAADAFVMPSRFEGLPISAIEAMACGIPAILYNVPGLRDLIESEESGYLTEPNYLALCDQLLCLAKDPATAAKRAQNAHRAVMRNYGMATCVGEIVALYCQASLRERVGIESRTPDSASGK